MSADGVGGARPGATPEPEALGATESGSPAAERLDEAIELVDSVEAHSTEGPTSGDAEEDPRTDPGSDGAGDASSLSPPPASTHRDGRFTRLLRFALVGTSGLGVNTVALWLAIEVLGLHYLPGAIAATQCSTAWNFALTEHWVFRAGRPGRWTRFIWFSLVNNAWLLARIPFLFVLIEWAGLPILLSNLIVLATSTIVRFAVADAVIWKEDRKGELESLPTRSGEGYFYDLHGIVRIRSAARLPELARFRVAALEGESDLTIEVGNGGFGGLRRNVAVETDGDVTSYVEHPGALGFALKVDMGAPVQVQVSRLLKWSPHVLYTNVVEPILRWMLVRQGFLLAHAACLKVDGQGVLITARTDTGKTTTCLRSIKAHGSGFASDDMIILGPDGIARAYPKPLTISAHTLKAASAAPLVLWRKTLLQAQGRVHSKGGRRVGLHLRRYNLPLATMNALVQMIVPPPKYFVEELIPAAKVVDSLSIQHMLVIERGIARMERLDVTKACQVLTENTEDAYGFPPYHLISKSLCNGDEPREAKLRRDFLEGLTITRLTTPDRDWYEQIPRVVAPRDRAPEDNLSPSPSGDPV